MTRGDTQRSDRLEKLTSKARKSRIR